MTTPEYITSMTNIDVIIRILLAVILGSIIGFERERRHKPAGLRTIILVLLGSTLLTVMAVYIYTDFNAGGNADIGRIVGQIITGIGFLGAGAIIQGRGSIHGMTTAATIWVVAAIGIANGLGYYLIAIIATILTLMILMILGIMEKREMESQNNENNSQLKS